MTKTKKTREPIAIQRKAVKGEDEHLSDFEQDVASSVDLQEAQDRIEYANLSSDFNSHSSDSEDYNPHNFTFAHDLDTIKKSKKERLEEMKATNDRDEHREKFKHKGKKGGGSTNKDKLKHKPMSMVK